MASKAQKKRRSAAHATLTLKDRLSRLSFATACRLLGKNGSALIREGGKFDINIAEAVYLRGDLFRLRVDGAVVTITLKSDARQRLCHNCTRCSSACVHVGAAYALILEEKTALGLAAPPRQRTPIESLDEETLVQQALAERQERADAERMLVRSTNAKRLWTDYLVTNSLTGKTYRVALRGWDPGASYCTCPDFRINTLGTCKHILHVQKKMRRKFPAATRNRTYRPNRIAVHLRYGPTRELRLLIPPRLDATAKKYLAPLADRAVEDARDLVRRIDKLAGLGYDVTIYPDAEVHIGDVLFRQHMADKVAEIRKRCRTHPLRKTLLRAELLPYQLDGIAFAAGVGRAILADDMGLGKTIQGIGVAELLAREAGISRVLIICPASLKAQWRNEIHRFCDRGCQLVVGTAEQRAVQYGADAFFTVCNYEQVLRDIIPIEQTPWDLIILDEGQRIKNWEAKTSRMIKGLRSRFALVLSGTPIENRLDDLFSVAQFVDERRLGPAFRFFNRHRVVDEDNYVLGYKNLDELRHRLRPMLLRRTRASVMKDLPPRTNEIIRIEPTAEQWEMHRGHLQTVRSIVSKPYISEMDLLRLRKALLACRMSADSTYLVDKQDPAYSTKLDALDDLIGSLFAEENRKAVLFSEWTTMLGLIEPLLDKHVIDYVRLDGSVPQRRRQQLVHRFQNDPACRVFITTNAGATGLNLQAADTVINVDLPWNPAVLEQRIGRAHRMGQKRPVQVYILITEHTIEEGMLGTLSAKHELANAALDTDSDIDKVDLLSSTEALKSRLESLLGKVPDAPIDESERTRQTEEAQRLARQQQVASAGGKLLTAAFAFIGDVLPEGAQTEATRKLAGDIRAGLADCVETDEQGQAKLTVTLPDASALDGLADALARLMEGVRSH